MSEGERKGISDVEIGRLIESVKNLEKQINQERIYTTNEFIKLNDKIEAYMIAMKDWQKTMDMQLKKDYTYLDGDKIEPLSIRVYELEKWKNEKIKEELDKKERDKNSWGNKIKDRLLTVIVSVIGTGLIGFILYFIGEYFRNGGKS